MSERSKDKSGASPSAGPAVIEAPTPEQVPDPEAPASPSAPAAPPAGPSAEEIEAALALIASRKQSQAIAEEAKSAYAPGYPKRLYNPTYKYEAIAVPLRDAEGNEIKDKQGLTKFSHHYRHFSNGSILAESPEDEAWLRASAGVPLFAKDTDDAQVCSCGWTAYSNAAIAVCLRHH